jgi:CDGSH-type Zn-finger protein
VKREFSPVAFELSETKSVWLCACKHTSNKPFCDGTHKRL